MAYPVHTSALGAPPPARTVSHNPWISTLSLTLGYVWLISGLDKMVSGKFIPGFTQYLSDLIAFAPQPLWYKTFLEMLILPHSTLVATLIQYGELALGILLIAASVQVFLRNSPTLFYTIALLHLAGCLLVGSIILSQGSPFPFINANKVFEGGVDLDYLLLFSSFCLVLINVREATLK